MQAHSRQSQETVLEEVQLGSADMNTLMDSIHGIIRSVNLNDSSIIDFIISMLDEDIYANIHFYRCNEGVNTRFLVEIDNFNGLYLPFESFINMIIPTYISIQAQTAFTGMTSIRDILDDMANALQEELERITVAVSEEEFKEATFNKKDMTPAELDASISACIQQTINNAHPLDECPICGTEDVKSYYECCDCHYRYCYDCCEEIASRQALCPCCRKPRRLIYHKQ